MGGDELGPGNEPQDRILVDAAGDGAAYILATAAARHAPERAVANARRWFAEFGLTVAALPATTRREVASREGVEAARAGRFFYLVGGDPGIVPDILGGSPLWDAVVAAWKEGAALAGSSAGAMALGAWTLIRDRHPGDARAALQAGARSGARRRRDPPLRYVRASVGGGRAASAPEPDAILIGIDERTAALAREGRWEVLGPGSVTVSKQGQLRRFPSGSTIEGLPVPVVPARGA